MHINLIQYFKQMSTIIRIELRVSRLYCLLFLILPCRPRIATTTLLLHLFLQQVIFYCFYLLNLSQFLITICLSLVSSINPSLENSTLSAKSSQEPSNKMASVLSGTSGSNSASTDSERTYRVDSQDSQVSDTETSGDRHWPRQNSVNELLNLSRS